MSRSPLLALTLVALAAVVSACGSSTSNNADAATSGTAAAQVTPGSVPTGTTLRFGDQLGAMQTVLASGGQNQGFPYSVKYASFVGGPAMLQAFQAGAIDAGFVGDSPMIFAQAAHQDVVAVAGFQTAHDTQELVAAPGSGITSWRGLEGKKVAYQQGTSLEAVLLEGLHSVGLGLSDVKSVNLPLTQVVAALQGGSVDAGVLVPPLDSAYLKSHPTATIVDRPNQLPLRLSFLVASKKALRDPGKQAAILDYALRLVRAYKSIQANPDSFINSFYVAQYHMTPAAGRALFDEGGGTSVISLPGDILADQQTLADLYTAAKELPGQLDVSGEFDSRFNSALQAAQKS
jgi:sulfonate transport system substrate-binding protein